VKKPVAAICTILAIVSLCTGIVALFVPMLPATPFLLLALASYMHCSPRFVSWFSSQPLYKCYIDDFLRERSMTRRNKIKTLVVGTLMIALSFFLMHALWARIMILAIMVVKYYYFVFCVWTKIEEGHGLRAEPQPDQNQKPGS